MTKPNWFFKNWNWKLCHHQFLIFTFLIFNVINILLTLRQKTLRPKWQNRIDFFEIENFATTRWSSTMRWRRTTPTPWGTAPRSPTLKRTRIPESFHVSNPVKYQKSFRCNKFLCNPSDDFNRVVLEPEEGVPDSDYINASYVDVSSPPLPFAYYSPKKSILEFWWDWKLVEIIKFDSVLSIYPAIKPF